MGFEAYIENVLFTSMLVMKDTSRDPVFIFHFEENEHQKDLQIHGKTISKFFWLNTQSIYLS